MSLENIGLGGVMTFDGQQAVTGMGQLTVVTNNFARSQQGLESRTLSLSNQLNQMAAVAGRLGLALTPLTATFGLGVKQAADFEQQMDAVGAVTRATDTDMARLEQKAKQMGVSTKFTATEAGLAMEQLARAGATTQETLDGLSGVMATAAADSIPLATAADVIAQVVRGMGLDFTQANHVADVLALTSATTNTDVIGLGESFKYAAAQARVMKIPLETTATLLGAAADAGLRGSIGGTSFTNMLVKLAAPSQKAAAWIKANNIEMTKTADGGLDVVSVLTQVSNALGGQTDVMKKAAVMTELFGLRGQKAYSAIEASIKSGRLPELFAEVDKADGAAEKMAARRLSNLNGQVELLKSVLEVFAIETAGAFLGPMTDSVKGFASAIGGVVEVLQVLGSEVSFNREEMEAKYGPATVAVALGIRDAIVTVIDAWKALKATVIDTIAEFTGQSSPEMIQSIAKWATMLFLVGAALAPILLAFAGIVLFVSTVVIPAVTALGSVIEVVAGLASGLAVPLLLIAGAFLVLRNDGESFGATMTRMWNAVSELGLWFNDNVLMPIVTAIRDAIMPQIDALQVKWFTFVTEAKAIFQQWFGAIIRTAQALAPLFSAIFKLLGTIVGNFVSTGVTAFGFLLQAITPILSTVKEVGLYILEYIVKALQKLAHFAIGAADFLGISNSEFFATLAEFSSQKFDLTSGAGRVASVEATQNLGKPGIKPPEKGPIGENTAFAQELSDIQAIQKGNKNKPPSVNVDVGLEDKRQLDINNCVTMDGREMAVATARHKQEVNERAGFRTTPWQRRQIAEQGAAPVGGVGGGG